MKYLLAVLLLTSCSTTESRIDSGSDDHADVRDKTYLSNIGPYICFFNVPWKQMTCLVRPDYDLLNGDQ